MKCDPRLLLLLLLCAPLVSAQVNTVTNRISTLPIERALIVLLNGARRDPSDFISLFGTPSDISKASCWQSVTSSTLLPLLWQEGLALPARLQASDLSSEPGYVARFVHIDFCSCPFSDNTCPQRCQLEFQSKCDLSTRVHAFYPNVNEALSEVIASGLPLTDPTRSVILWLSNNGTCASILQPNQTNIGTGYQGNTSVAVMTQGVIPSFQMNPLTMGSHILLPNNTVRFLAHLYLGDQVVDGGGQAYIVHSATRYTMTRLMGGLYVYDLEMSHFQSLLSSGKAPWVNGSCLVYHFEYIAAEAPSSTAVRWPDSGAFLTMGVGQCQNNSQLESLPVPGFDPNEGDGTKPTSNNTAYKQGAASSLVSLLLSLMVFM